MHPALCDGLTLPTINQRLLSEVYVVKFCLLKPATAAKIDPYRMLDKLTKILDVELEGGGGRC